MNARTRQGRLIGANEWTGRPSLELEFFYAEGEGGGVFLKISSPVPVRLASIIVQARSRIRQVLSIKRKKGDDAEVSSSIYYRD